nr:A/G-specific adenine glycosylase [Candidatus Symbiobacter mobilis]
MPPAIATPDFAAIVLRWQAHHGRHDLPWQHPRDPYRVWLSEVMLQQTRVQTVLAYFPRFLERFPDITTLACAPEEDVLAAWAGMGYYGRARNLHRCAQQVMACHGGAFPRSAAQLRTLPGIGASTAHAIAALCFGERVAIFDANVRRVLARFLGFGADLSVRMHEHTLWAEATRLLPQSNDPTDLARYTQGMMDLGATVCTARSPRCADCPLRAECVAYRLGTPQRFPHPPRRIARELLTMWLLWVQADDDALWLLRRPSRGIWAGLYCLPTCPTHAAVLAALPPHATSHTIPPIQHELTHRTLLLHPVYCRFPCRIPLPLEGQWMSATDWPTLGFPAPIRRLLLEQPPA